MPLPWHPLSKFEEPGSLPWAQRNLLWDFDEIPSRLRFVESLLDLYHPAGPSVARDLSLKIARHMCIGFLPFTMGYFSASAHDALKYDPEEKSDSKNSLSSSIARDCWKARNDNSIPHIHYMDIRGTVHTLIRYNRYGTRSTYIRSVPARQNPGIYSGMRKEIKEIITIYFT